MKSKLKVMLVMCALLIGFSVTAAAQTTYRTRNGRVVTVYGNGSRVARRPNGRTVYSRPNGRTVVVLPNGNRVWRNSRSSQTYGQVARARTYRLPNGRLVTVLPNGRRIYR
jgi:hypothetical protein